MDRVASLEVLEEKRRHVDHLGVEGLQVCVSRSAFSSLARIARSVSRLNSVAPNNTQAWPPIRRHWTCFSCIEEWMPFMPGNFLTFGVT